VTQSEKDNIQYTFHRFQQAREKFYVPKFFAALQKQTKEAIAQIKQGNHPVISSQPIIEVIKPLYIDCATVYGHKIQVMLKRDQKARMPMGFSDRMYWLIVQYYGIDFLNTSEGITQTTREYVAQVLTDSYRRGLGIDDIVKLLENTEINRNRARVIARTETVAAANNGGLFVARDTGIELNKIWVAARDNRTRKDHVLADNKKVGLDELFTVGGYKMMVPGDRGGKDGRQVVAPKEYVNCRCTTVYEKA